MPDLPTLATVVLALALFAGLRRARPRGPIDRTEHWKRVTGK